MSRRLLLLVVSVVMVTMALGVFAAGAVAAPFPDLPENVLSGYDLEEIEIRGMSEGFEDGLWKPSNAMTRAQFVKMAVEFFSIPQATPASPTFLDVPMNDLFFPYIEGAAAAGLVRGVGGDLFAPYRPIMRQEAVAILVRWLARSNGLDTANIGSAEIAAALEPFGDESSVGPDLRDEAALGVSLEMLRGSGGNLLPRRALLRIEGAAFIARTGELLGSVYKAELEELNDSGVAGDALLFLRDMELKILVLARGLETNRQHMQHIHGLAGGANATCPPESADTDQDGIISLAEGLPFYGPVLRPLDPYPTAAGSDGEVFYSHRFLGKELADLELGTVSLTQRTIVLHGLTVAGSYDPSVPVACGEIEAVSLAYRADLDELNDSGASGQALLWHRDDQLRVLVMASGLETGAVHPQHIHGFGDGTPSICPPPSADANQDGIISLAEAEPYNGPVIFPFDPFPTASGPAGTIFYARAFSGDQLDPLNLDNTPLTDRIIHIHGLTVGGAYDPSVPVACGEIEDALSLPGAGEPSDKLALARNKVCDLRSDMRSLWMYHGWYTREVVLAAALDGANLTESLNALLDNQKDTGDAIAAYFGQAAGEAFTDLLTDHINIAVEVVTAAKAGDQAAFEEANARWQANAEDIAAAAAQVNPEWVESETLAHLQTHLSTLTDMVVAVLAGEWADAIVTNDILYRRHFADGGSLHRRDYHEIA